MHFDVVLSIYSSMLKKSEESSVDAAVCLRALRVCARFRCVRASDVCVCVLQMCVCARFRCVCVCVRALRVCVCASDVCVCVRALRVCVCTSDVCVCARFRCVCSVGRLGAGCRPIGLLLIGLDRRITHWAGRPNLGCF